jgi:acetaldehyde dehydrogenase
MKRIRVAILGTGNIGTDLCYRLLKDDHFEVVALVGRRADSPGLKLFKNQIPHLISEGIAGLVPHVAKIDGFFDATSAFDHMHHWEVLGPEGKWAIDLTPSKIGTPFVPELHTSVQSMVISQSSKANYSMVTCGGQSSAPLIYSMSMHSESIQEVEVSSSIAALSAGPATRRNIDQYVQSTENLASLISGCSEVKAILVLNPAEPPVMMRTTVQMKVRSASLDKITDEANTIISRIQKYVPGYELIVAPHFSTENIVSATVKVTGAGYYLPPYAGNLDIINAAAVETAKIHTRLLAAGE